MKNLEFRIKKILIVLAAFVLLVGPFAQAQTLNPFDPAFKLSICDGPAGAPNVKTPCDFKGLLAQVQFLINAMIVLGVLAAIVMITYGGILYLTGVPGKIEQAKRIFRNVGIGFLMMLTAWVIVYQILVWLGANPGFTTLLGTPA